MKLSRFNSHAFPTHNKSSWFAVTSFCNFASSLPMATQGPPFQSFDCLLCDKKCHSSGRLLKHQELKHPNVTLPEDATQYTCICHPYINGMNSFISCLICSIHKFQGSHVWLMGHLYRLQFLNSLSMNQWILHLITHGLLFSRIELPLISPSTIMLNSSLLRVRLRKDLTCYVPWASNMVCMMVHHGKLPRSSMQPLTLSKPVALHGNPTNFDIMDRSHPCHHVGWRKSTNSIFETS